MRKAMIVFAAAAAVGCGGVSKEKKEADKYQKALQDETGKVTALEEQNAALKKQVDDLGAQLSQTAAAKSDVEVKAARLAEQANQLQGQQTLRLDEQLLFKENSSVLTPEAKKTLDSMSEAISQIKGKTLVVAAYTDDKEGTGKDPKTSRWQLSTARAIGVAKYLAGRGIDPKMIAVAGFGEARPVAPNDTLANRALNRRAEIALAPQNAQLKTIEMNPATIKP
jgi:chemotaxis protein MotB